MILTIRRSDRIATVRTTTAGTKRAASRTTTTTSLPLVGTGTGIETSARIATGMTLAIIGRRGIGAAAEAVVAIGLPIGSDMMKMIVGAARRARRRTIITRRRTASIAIRRNIPRITRMLDIEPNHLCHLSCIRWAQWPQSPPLIR